MQIGGGGGVVSLEREYYMLVAEFTLFIKMNLIYMCYALLPGTKILVMP